MRLKSKFMPFPTHVALLTKSYCCTLCSMNLSMKYFSQQGTMAMLVFELTALDWSQVSIYRMSRNVTSPFRSSLPNWRKSCSPTRNSPLMAVSNCNFFIVLCLWEQDFGNFKMSDRKLSPLTKKVLSKFRRILINQIVFDVPFKPESLSWTIRSYTRQLIKRGWQLNGEGNGFNFRRTTWRRRLESTPRRLAVL